MVSVKENQIRPRKIFNKYLQLCKKDIIIFFDKSKKENIKCPACSEKGEVFFKKYKFNYEKCRKCKTIYNNPRPLKKYFDSFYLNGKSTKFWSTDFYSKTSVIRKKKLWQPKIKLIKKITKNKKFINIIDIGAGYGDFLDLAKNNLAKNTIAIEPSNNLSTICVNKGHKVIRKFVETINKKEIPLSSNLFCSFELFEHVHNPYKFLKKIYNIMRKNNYFIFTTLSGTGIDIENLNINSKSIFPPHHINFLNPISIEILLKKIKFKNITVITPGKLDIDIMKNNIKFIKNEFWKTFLENSNKSELNKMQNFISNNKLSSHMMVLCQK